MEWMLNDSSAYLVCVLPFKHTTEHENETFTRLRSLTSAFDQLLICNLLRCANGSSQELMCEIDNARPKFKNLQMAEKSRRWLGFWRFLDQKSQRRNYLMKTIRTKSSRKNSNNYRKDEKVLDELQMSGVHIEIHSGAKKAPKPSFLGKFCTQKILGKFWPMGDPKKV